MAFRSAAFSSFTLSGRRLPRDPNFFASPLCKRPDQKWRMRPLSLHRPPGCLPAGAQHVRMALLGHTAHLSRQRVVPGGSQGRPDNRAWVIDLASGGWLKLILLRVPRGSPKVAVWGADRPSEHLHTSSTPPTKETYPKADTGPNDDNGTAGATGLGLSYLRY
jgi:hypothetical protein